MTAMEQAVQWCRQQHLEIVAPTVPSLNRHQVWLNDQDGVVSAVDRLCNSIRFFYGEESNG